MKKIAKSLLVFLILIMVCVPVAFADDFDTNNVSGIESVGGSTD